MDGTISRKFTFRSKILYMSKIFLLNEKNNIKFKNKFHIKIINLYNYKYD